MKRPLVSIIICTYNRAYLIERALGSLLRQDYPHWEAIVVDDGSTDDTAAVLSRYADSRIRLVTHSENRGITSTRNSGLDSVRGDWFGFLDSDDEILPNAISVMMSVPLDVDQDVTAVLCRAIDASTGRPIEVGLSPGHLDKVRIMQGEGWYLIRTEAIRGARFIPGLNTFESEWWLRILPGLNRYLIADTLRIYHTEADDRVTVSQEQGTTKQHLYEQWARVFDANPRYLVMRHRAGLGNPFPDVIELFNANGDNRRAAAALRLARRARLAPSTGRDNLGLVAKRRVIRVLRFLRLKPPAPESERCAD